MQHLPHIYSVLILLAALALTACRTDIVVYPSEDTLVTTDSAQGGIYLLNEGNMGSNKARLDYMNLQTGIYTANIYGEQNPNQVKELGDVGNDIKAYGSKLYAVINCSHKVEIMDLQARRITQLNLPNCRYLAFANGKAYVSAYVGSVIDPELLGSVYEIDTTTMQVSREVKVGHQPDEMAILGNRLYVCNSGGYLTDRYDSTLSVIDLTTFQIINTISVGLNPGRIRADRQGRLWVACRGNLKDIKPSLVLVENNLVTQRFDLAVDNLSLLGDTLYLLDANAKKLYLANTKNQQITPHHALSQALSTYEKPYGILATRQNIYLTDAKNYVSSGMLYAYAPDGKQRWTVKTGDIPAALCEVGIKIDLPEMDTTITTGNPYLHQVYEYRPAIGQFINTMPKYEEGDNEAAMCRKCEEAIANNAGGMVSLGGWGGYITFGFDHAVPNIEGQRDFQILGNAYYMPNSTTYGSSEPGIVMVARDLNHNGIPDDTWYELKGSEHSNHDTQHQVSMTYTRRGDTIHNPFHKQPYYPQWIAEDEMTFTGTMLPPTTEKISGQFVQRILEYGYADNKPNTDSIGTSFDISWAVDSEGKPVVLPCVDFIRIYTATHESNKLTGEVSTEICGAIDLHALNNKH